MFKAHESYRLVMRASQRVKPRLSFHCYLERGFTANPGDMETLTTLLGHAPRSYQEFAKETAASWKAAQ